MGGQIADAHSLHLDLRYLNRLISLDPEARTVRAQAGMTWRDLQDAIDPHDLSVAVMQSYSNFTLGGSISVNCHGRYVGKGPIAHTVRALRLVTADGESLELTRQREPELFSAVIGGYGGLGVVTEVELDLATNERIERRIDRVSLDEYPNWFREHVLADPAQVLHNADLTSPDFAQPLAVSWRRTQAPLTVPDRLVPRDLDYRREKSLIWAASELPGAAKLRQQHQSAMQEESPPVVWRNHEASLDVASLEPTTRAMTTYFLQEYFIPVPAFGEFARAMARILRRHEVNALNVSIRHSPPDRDSLMRWASQESFCFVIYYKEWRRAMADAKVAQWSRELIDEALACGGRYYLPYRCYATQAQFLRAYPEAERYAQLKRKWDPQARFRNALLNRYLPNPR